jgi:MYXO-CTERM domain-containing protein
MARSALWAWLAIATIAVVGCGGDDSTSSATSNPTTGSATGGSSSGGSNVGGTANGGTGGTAGQGGTGGVAPKCGDGNTDSGESCDDGNTADGDGCSATCTDEDAGGPPGDGGCCGTGSGPTGPAALALITLGAVIRRRRRSA